MEATAAEEFFLGHAESFLLGNAHENEGSLEPFPSISAWHCEQCPSRFPLRISSATPRAVIFPDDVVDDRLGVGADQAGRQLAFDLARAASS
jgi:hypothetical protein